MSNYPPGVTGNEYAIAGGTAVRGTVTREVSHECPEDRFEEEFEGEVEVDDVEVYGYTFTGFYICPKCKTEMIPVEWEAEEAYDDDL